MKIAVYAIAKNEEKNVAAFMKSANEADAVCVLDTGSTDNTLQLLRESCGIVQQQQITPWRFDVARNESLKLVPTDMDVVVMCDLDERFPPGWRKKMEAVWKAETTRLNVRYIFSWNADGTPGIVYHMARAHVRHGYVWAHPAHECLQWQGDRSEVIQDTDEVELHHFQNKQTSRKQYLTLLEMGVKEDPGDERNSHYLAREYLYVERWQDCIAESTRHLSLPNVVWAPERAMSASFIARSHDALNHPGIAEQWYLRAISEFQDRDHWVRLAYFYHHRHFWAGAYASVVRGLQFTQRPPFYFSDPQCWGAWPEDIAGYAAFKLGLKKECQMHYDRAVALAPQDKRIAKDRTCALELLRKGEKK